MIIVLSDDQGYGDFSCHGNPVLKTPNLDKLHDQSIRLTDFHVAPMCTPHARRADDRTRLPAQRRHLGDGRPFDASPRADVMPEIFAASGYRTGHFGKWHLGEAIRTCPISAASKKRST